MIYMIIAVPIKPIMPPIGSPAINPGIANKSMTRGRIKDAINLA